MAAGEGRGVAPRGSQRDAWQPTTAQEISHALSAMPAPKRACHENFPQPGGRIAADPLIRLLGWDNAISGQEATMADPQVDTAPEAAAPRARSARPPGEDTAVGVEGERRAFAATDEVVGVVRGLSTVAAEATKQVAERTRQATRDVASSWRGAVERENRDSALITGVTAPRFGFGRSASRPVGGGSGDARRTPGARAQRCMSGEQHV